MLGYKLSCHSRYTIHCRLITLIDRQEPRESQSATHLLLKRPPVFFCSKHPNSTTRAHGSVSAHARCLSHLNSRQLETSNGRALPRAGVHIWGPGRDAGHSPEVEQQAGRGSDVLIRIREPGLAVISSRSHHYRQNPLLAPSPHQDTRIVRGRAGPARDREPRDQHRTRRGLIASTPAPGGSLRTHRITREVSHRAAQRLQGGGGQIA